MAVPIKWHYTTGQKFRMIVESGEIKPATAGVPPGEKPIVWFSTAPDWEPTANKAWRNPDGTIAHLDREQTAKLAGGLVRFGVASEIAPYDWHALKELSGMSNEMAQGLDRAAIEQGSRPGQWWGTFDAVPRSKWIAIQVHRDGQWVDAALDPED
jgi:hypothetical protein